MITTFQIIGVCFVIYISMVGIIMLFTKCSVDDARKKISSFFQENSYELSRDYNYIQSINTVANDILGKARYDELCSLDKHCSTLQFCDNHDGLPSVKITFNCNDENEKRRLEAILESITRKHLLNYRTSPYTNLLLEWSQNKVLQLPMLIIMYSRNETECKMLDVFKQSSIDKVSLKYGDVLDDTDELL